MDEMKICSAFLKGVIAKIVKMVIKSKLGYEVDIQLSELYVTIDDGKAHIHVNANAEMSTNDLMKIVKKTGL